MTVLWFTLLYYAWFWQLFVYTHILKLYYTYHSHTLLVIVTFTLQYFDLLLLHTAKQVYGVTLKTFYITTTTYNKLTTHALSGIWSLA